MLISKTFQSTYHIFDPEAVFKSSDNRLSLEFFSEYLDL